MTNISRREALVLGVAAAAVAALPAVPAIAAPAEPPLLAWAVGTPGECDWQHIVATTRKEAMREYAASWAFEECAHDEIDEECECCEKMSGLEAERVKQWDGKKDLKAADWLKAGMGAICTHCGYECHPEDGAKPIGDDAVCEECQREIERIAARQTAVVSHEHRSTGE